MIPGNSRRPRWRLPGGAPGLGVAAAVLIGVMVVLYAYWTRPPSGSVAGPTGYGAPAACRGSDLSVSDPTGPHGLYVLDPATNPASPQFHDVARYLINSTVVCGVDFWVHWSDLDRGPGTSPEYNWSSVLSEMEPWVAAGKTVNLIFWAVGYGPNATYVPSSVLSSVGTVQCGNSPITPYFWEPSYVQNYSAFIRAAVAEFGTNSAIGYLRFGLGTGGETFPLYDITHPGCQDVLNSTGFTIPVWDSYLESMIQFEGSLNSTHPLMVALDGGLGGSTDHTFSDIAQWAVADGLGFGSEAITAQSVQLDGSGNPVCQGVGFCSLFDRYAGQAPLEIQTQGPSSPSGGAPIGSLVPIVRYVLAQHAQILELYTQDWLVAYDPSSPNYGAYHQAYADALGAAAAVVG